MLSSAEGKNHNVLLMMMAVTFAAVTASQIAKEKELKHSILYGKKLRTIFNFLTHAGKFLLKEV